MEETVKLCECGCNEPAPVGKRFKQGHNFRGRKSKQEVKMNPEEHMEESPDYGNFEQEKVLRTKENLEMSSEEMQVYIKKLEEQNKLLTPPEPKVPSETYKEVVFSPKSDPNDINNVELIVQGDPLVCQRGVKVIVPQRYLECADHGTRAVYEQLPDKPRKIVGAVQTYPYTVVRDNVSEEEYLEKKRKGDQLTRAALHLDETGFGLEVGV